MHEAIIQYLNTLSDSPLSEHDRNFIRNYFKPRRIRKRQYFLQEGEICKSVGFIIKGAMRQYWVDNKGVEYFSNLYIENWWVSDREGFSTGLPSKYNIDAWEDTDILAISYEHMCEFKAIPSILRIAHKLDERNHIASQKRINASIGMSAQQRYIDLVSKYPSFPERFPQYIIASFLGLSKETLSRVRVQSSRK